MDLPLTQKVLYPRNELRIEPIVALGKESANGELPAARWVVFDPVTRGSFRIGWIEHWFLARLNGKLSFADLVAKFRSEQPESKISDGSLLSLLDRLIQSRLCRYQGIRTSQAVSKTNPWAHWLAYRIRGLNPDAWLGDLAKQTDFLLSKMAVVFWLGAACVTLLLVLFDFQRLNAASHLWSWVLSPHASFSLFLTFLVTRAIHELGHALSCKRFGVRCPDIGMFLILGAPCVYCDVSESWSLQKRWQRAAVAAAGMYFEIVVAVLAAWVWLLTLDSPINTLALQTMFVCSVSTVLININPLMRFDGYHILADALDETNLRTRADHLAYAALRRLLLGAEWSFSGGRRTYGLVSFSIAGWIYRGFLSVAIATILTVMGDSWNLIWPSRLLAALILLSWWGLPLFTMVTDLFTSARTMFQKSRLILFGFVLVLLIVLLPVPSRRFASGWTQPVSSQGVFAGSDGRLLRCFVQDGQKVDEEAALFQLVNPELKRVAIKRKGSVAEARQKRSLQRRLVDMHGEEIDLNAYETQVAASEVLAVNAQKDVEQLLLKAPQAGLFSAGQGRDLEPDMAPTHGHAWTASLQVGRYVKQGTLLGTVCSEQALAVLPLNESQLRDVAAGVEVRLCIGGIQEVLFERVESIVQTSELDTNWTETNERDQSLGFEALENTRFAAVVSVPEHVRCLPGTTVEAVFVVPSTTMAQICVSWLKANLRFLAD